VGRSSNMLVGDTAPPVVGAKAGAMDGDAAAMMVEPATASSAAVVTAQMEEEEQKLQAMAQKDDAAATAAVTADFADKSVRNSRLNTLLEKSSLYSSFLADRMKKQQEQAALKAKKKKKAAAAGGAAAADDASAAGGSAAARRASSRASTQKATAAAVIQPSGPRKRRSPRKGAEAVGKKKRRTRMDSQDFNDETGPAESADVALAAAEDGAADETRKLADGTDVSKRQPRLFVGGALREYQLDGMEWLTALYDNGLNGILADEMGLGKTVQCIAFFCHLYGNKVKGPFLVVGPLSTLPNWHAEFTRFAPKIPTVLYHGTPEERAEKRSLLNKEDPVLKSYPVVITSYEIVVRDRRHLQGIPWKYVIVDEGHRLKNLNCRLIRELKTYRVSNRLLLTGTPLQNNLTELWSLLNFLLPDIFDDLEQFQRWFDFDGVGEAEANREIVEKEQQNAVVSKLHGILKPFLLRRLKTDVELSIPDKKEVVLYAPLTVKQKDMYAGIVDRTLHAKLKFGTDGAEPPLAEKRAKGSRNYREISDREFFDRLETTDDAVEAAAAAAAAAAAERDSPKTPRAIVNLKMTNVVMQLRKAANHPYLIEWPLDKKGFAIADERLVKVSGKMMVLDRLLARLKAGGHKVLIFSQFTTVLDILEDVCALRSYDYCRLDGSVPFAERKEAMERYNTDPDCFAFLLSTRAGGLGINLIAADTVIIYDSDWNPQADLQAQDRCHRIGQKNTVMVYRLITANTIDQRILDRAEAKRKLEKLVIHRGKFKGEQGGGLAHSKLSPDELLELISDNVARQVTVDDPKTVISDEILDKVLDRSTKVDKLEGDQFKVTVHKADAAGKSLLASLATA